MKSFFAELKRRKVYRVAAAYVVVAWMLAQGADLVLSNTSAPEWAIQVILLLLALGFPIALVLSWAYELTPDNTKRADAPENSEAIVSELLPLPSRLPPAPASAKTSIMVMPVQSVSAGEDSEILAIGLDGEIADALTRIGGVRVISRLQRKYGDGEAIDY